MPDDRLIKTRLQVRWTDQGHREYHLTDGLTTSKNEQERMKLRFKHMTQDRDKWARFMTVAYDRQTMDNRDRNIYR